MSDCLRIQCRYYHGGCSVNLGPEHPECPLYNELRSRFVCSACDFCGQPAEARMELRFMCLLTDDARTRQIETTCYCVCQGCKGKYEEVVQIYKDRLEEIKRTSSLTG
ncbi:MAG TPA: hypothetical protein GX711_09245 [Clostridia bacterium]|jgi:hypothetical protein|nr:hypothetical protein [Clostridia bacterium]